MSSSFNSFFKLVLAFRSAFPHLLGGHTRRAERGVGGQYFGRRETLGFPSYSNNLSRFFPVLSSETLVNVAFLGIQSVVLSLPVSTLPRSPPRQTKKSRIGRLELISLLMQYFIKDSVTVCNKK